MLKNNLLTFRRKTCDIFRATYEYSESVCMLNYIYKLNLISLFDIASLALPQTITPFHAVNAANSTLVKLAVI